MTEYPEERPEEDTTMLDTDMAETHAEDTVEVGTSESHVPPDYTHLPERHWKVTKQVVAQNLLFEHSLMNSDLLRFVTPEKLRKEIPEPELPYPLLRWMPREEKMKLLPSFMPD